MVWAGLRTQTEDDALSLIYIVREDKTYFSLSLTDCSDPQLARIDSSEIYFHLQLTQSNYYLKYLMQVGQLHIFHLRRILPSISNILNCFVKETFSLLQFYKTGNIFPSQFQDIEDIGFWKFWLEGVALPIVGCFGVTGKLGSQPPRRSKFFT